MALHHGVIALPKIAVIPHPIMAGSDQERVPTIDTHQLHGADKILVLPRGGRSTFVVQMGDDT